MPRVIPAFKQFFAFNSVTSVLEPLVNGWLQFYATQTTSTPKDTYSDLLETIPNPNPLQLDSEGRCPNVFGTGGYKVVYYSNDPINDVPDVQIASFDPVPGNTDVYSILVSANDTTPGILNGKLVAGDGIQFTELNDAANESLLLTIVNRVRTTEDETISGVKTFSSSPIVPNPTEDQEVASKSYVDSTLVSTSPTAVANVLPEGCSILFNQASPPVSWTKKSDWAANASLVVGNTYGSGGSNSPTSWATSIAVANHAAHTHTGPSHTHGYSAVTAHTHTIPMQGNWSVTGVEAVTGACSQGSNNGGAYTNSTGSTGGSSEITAAAGTGNTGNPSATLTHSVTQSTYNPVYTIVIAAIKNAYA